MGVLENTHKWRVTGGQSTLPDREHRPHPQRQAERRHADRHGQLPRDGGDEDGGPLRRRAISAVRRGRERALGAIQSVIVVCPLSFVRLAMDQFRLLLRGALELFASLEEYSEAL